MIFGRRPNETSRWRRPSGRRHLPSPAAPVREVAVWSRAGCHLCEELLDQVRRVAAQDRTTLALEVRDLDAVRESDPATHARLTTLVPVLVVDDREVGHLRLADDEIRAALRA